MGRIERTQCDPSFCLFAFHFHYGGLVRFLPTSTAASRRRAVPLLGADPLYELARRAPDAAYHCIRRAALPQSHDNMEAASRHLWAEGRQRFRSFVLPAA